MRKRGIKKKKKRHASDIITETFNTRREFLKTPMKSSKKESVTQENFIPN